MWTFTKAETLSSTTRSDGINAQGISIRWKAADFAAATTTSHTSTTATTPASNTATSTASATNEVASSNDNGLSIGAKAGIGIGVAIGVLALIGVAVLLWIRRRKSQPSERDDEKSQNNTVHPVNELDGRYIPAELDAEQKRRAELAVTGPFEIAELDSGHHPPRRSILNSQ